VADQPAIANAALGALRLEMARREKLIQKGEFAFVWITDFPLLEYDDTQEAFHGGSSPVYSTCSERSGPVNGTP
jgi:aspartyl-tRNA synthetase